MSHVETMVSFILWHLAIYPRAVCEGQDGLMKNPGSHELTGPGLESNFSSSPPGLPPYLATWENNVPFKVQSRFESVAITQAFFWVPGWFFPCPPKMDKSYPRTVDL